MIELEEYMRLSRELEKHHSIFYALWEIGRPCFTNMIETAGIEFDQDGEQINFLFNQDYWQRLNDDEKKFVICHECLHVILNHGIRTKDSENQLASNIALDIVDNHMLINKFGFERNKLSSALCKEKPGDKLCWVDTVFPNDNVANNLYFEHYFNLLRDKCDTGAVLVLVDDHTKIGQRLGEILKKAGQKLGEEERDALRKAIEKHFDKTAGDSPGGHWLFADTKSFVQKKRKWETIIKKWSRNFLKKDVNEVEQWARLNRRFAFLTTDLMLPSEMEIEHEKKEERKIEVYFFLDTSWSCHGFEERFFKAARSLPPERFDVRLFCFDTQIYPTSLESGKLYGFGGTYFDIIEKYIQRNMALTKEKYPDSVWVLSDGRGNNVYPEYPSLWYWFLTTNYTTYIPKKCNVHQLVDFE